MDGHTDSRGDQLGVDESEESNVRDSHDSKDLEEVSHLRGRP